MAPSVPRRTIRLSIHLVQKQLGYNLKTLPNYIPENNTKNGRGAGGLRWMNRESLILWKFWRYFLLLSLLLSWSL